MDTSKMESTDICQVEEMLLAQLEGIAEKKDRIWLVVFQRDTGFGRTKRQKPKMAENQ